MTDMISVEMTVDEARVLAQVSSTVRVALADAGIGEACTGVTAAWCPIHGDCRCFHRTADTEELSEYLDSTRCPLHAPSSSHGIEAP